MKSPWLLLALAPLAAAQTVAQLDEVARVASVMVDGDVAKRIVTDRAIESIMKVDKRDPYIASDNYDVHHEPFLHTKKTLIRLSRLVDFPCDVNLWMPLPTTPPRVHIVIRNANEMSRFWQWGALHQEMFPPMKEVFEKGKRVAVADKPGWIAILAPVRDSLGDIVGLVEVVARQAPDPRENVK
ncbi:MAG: hypothetical protein KIT09_21195 [Bryobacteraceae bacterium]|nr:hypothetical protein [Bryobacteraceae bacterium]